MNKEYVSDELTISVDFSPSDEDCMVVARRKGDEVYIINMLANEEAIEIYNKLIGK